MRFLTIFLFLVFTGHALADDSPITGKALVVGSEPDFPPLALGNTEQTASGFTVELWKAVAAESHINYTLRVKPFNQLLKEFKNGQIDVLINLAQSAERHTYADFTVPTAIVNGAIFVRKGETHIHSEADLSGKAIIVINADLAYDYAMTKGWQKQLVLTQTAEDGLKLLATGKYDAMLLSKLVGLQALEQLKLSNVKPLMNNAGYAQKFSFAVHEGESDLLAKINEGLALTKSSGVYDRLYDKWFGVYEQKQIIDRLLLNFIEPFFLVSAVFFGYLFYKWRALRQFSQQQIQASQQRIQLALEGGDLGLWDWEILSGNLFVNERWKEMLGLQPDEIVSHISDWEKRVHPDDWQYMNPVLEGYLQGTIPRFESEYRLLHTDGHWIWVTDRGKVVERSPEGEPLRMVGTHLDISDRKEKQFALEIILAQQNAMLENEVIGIAKVRKSCFIWTSPTFDKIVGYDRNELIGMPTSHLFISQEVYEVFSNDCHLTLNNLKLYRTRVIQICKNGKQIWVDLSCNRLNQQTEEVIVVIIDVTEQKLAAEDIRINQERLQLALQGANDGMWDWNYETDEVYYSPRWKSMLGYAEDELPNTLDTYAKLADPADRDMVYQKARQHVEGKLPTFEVEFRMRHKDGHWVDILSRGKLAVDNNGEKLMPLRMIGTHVDISERKHQEQHRLAQEMAHRNLLVREVHHRIKNNIQGITGILRQFAEAHPETFDPINQAISQMKSLAIVYGLQGHDTKPDVQLSELLIFIARGIESLWGISISVNVLPANVICTIAKNEAVPLALVINELLLNAVKHAGHPEQVNVILKADLSKMSITLSINNTGQLPPGFDFYNRRHFNTGLDLVTSLLPQTGAKLSFEQQGSTVVTSLECRPPVINLEVQSFLSH